MVCPVCHASDNFRLSKFRSTDVNSLLTLRYPVRCRTCSHRIYVGAFTAIHLRQEAKRKRVANSPTGN
jgi:hypothetical protein